MPTPEEQAQSMIRNLEDKTGKPLSDWLEIVATSKLEKHGAIVKLLKSEHGITHGYANLIAHQARNSAAAHSKPTDLVAAQYAGKEKLLPIYERIAAAVSGFGSDVELAPKKAYVSLRRKKQFALVQPSTKTRVDVGIQLRSEDSTRRLEDSGSFNAMVSHRVRLTTIEEVDDQLLDWLHRAYRAAG